MMRHAMRCLALVSVAAGVLLAACAERESPPLEPSCTLVPAPDTLRLTFGLTGDAHVATTCAGTVQPVVRWASSDTSIVAVDSTTGAARALRAGVATLRAAVTNARGATAFVVAIVSCPPVLLVAATITPQAVTIGVNQSTVVRASATRAIGGPTCATIVDTAFTYTSLDTAVATVDSTTGVVTGRRSGQTLVKATLLANRSLSASVPVTVTPTNAAGIVLSVAPEALALAPWETTRVDARVTLPAGAPADMPRGVAFRTSDSCGVRIGADGAVIAGASAFGTITILALADTNVRVAVPVMPIRVPRVVDLTSVTAAGAPADLGALHGVVTFGIGVDGQSLTGGGRLELSIAGRSLGIVTLPIVRGSSARTPASLTVDLDARDATGARLFPLGAQTLTIVLTTNPGVSPFAGCGGASAQQASRSQTLTLVGS